MGVLDYDFVMLMLGMDFEMDFPVVSPVWMSLAGCVMS
jgi:hypothetical protein